MLLKLNVLERMLIAGILPKEGDLTTILILRQLKEALSFNEEEHALLKFRYEGTGVDRKVFWEDNVVSEKEIDLKPKAQQLISDSLDKLNEEKKLQEEHLALWIKIKGEVALEE